MSDVVSVTVRLMDPSDWSAVRNIYAAGIATRNATFETAAPTWERWDSGHLDDHRLVATGHEGIVVGWAALSSVSDRCVYAGVAEDGIYIDPGHRARGIGHTLLDALISGAEAAGIWTIQSGIFPENTASLVLHERCRFRIVGRRERIGMLDGIWRDTLFLERRSQAIG